jgi:tripartite-type tricarboxylate transporter receptor subunit TctC
MKKMICSFRKISTILLSTALIWVLPTTVGAQKEYPNRPITIIIQYPVGGGADVAVRGLAEQIQRKLGQPVLVESKPGAAGIIAGDYVAKSKPDGYTIGAFTSPACDPDPYSNLYKASYKGQDLKPIVRYLAFAYALVSRKDAPWRNLSEFMKHVKDNPDKVTWGNIGPGQRFTIFGDSLSKMYNLKMTPVSFKGAADIVVALLGGHVDVGIVTVASVMGHVKSGKMMMLGVQYPERVAYMPEIPTFKEQGYV